MILVIYGAPADKIGPEGIASGLVENPLGLGSCGIYSDTVMAAFQAFPGFVTVIRFPMACLFVVTYTGRPPTVRSTNAPTAKGYGTITISAIIGGP